MYGTSIVLIPGFIYQWNRMEEGTLQSRDWLLMSISAIFLALHFGSWIWSLDHTSLVHSLLFVTSHPLVVVALMPLIVTSVRRGHVLGAVIGFMGFHSTARSRE